MRCSTELDEQDEKVDDVQVEAKRCKNRTVDRVPLRSGLKVDVLDPLHAVRGQAGETLNVTVQHGTNSKTFSVSLGSDGIATPGRLILE